MFKLVVLLVLVAVSMAAPAPGLLHAPVAYAIPTAVSHQSRVDIHHAPVLATTYSVAPAVAHVAAPVLGHGHILHRSALIGAPFLGHGLGLGYAALPGIHGW